MRTAVLQTRATIDQVRKMARKWLHEPKVRRNARQPDLVGIQSDTLERLSDQDLRQIAVRFGLPLRRIVDLPPFAEEATQAENFER